MTEGIDLEPKEPKPQPKPAPSRTGWLPRATTAVLLSLLPAYAAGLVALALFSRASPRVTAASVAISFLAAFAAAGAWTHRSLHDHDGVDHIGVSPPDSRRWSTGLLAAAIPVSLLITFPRLAELGRLIIGNTGDSGLVIYLLEWQLHALVEDLGSYLEPNIFAPERFTLFWSTSHIPMVPLYALAKLATGNIVSSFNLLMVVTTVATLVATYLFVRKLGFDEPVAGLGALLYTTTSQKLSHLAHLDSVQTLWVPLAAVAFLRLWEKRRARDGLLLGVVLGLSLYAAAYYFVAGAALVGSAALFGATCWRRLPWKGLVTAGLTASVLAAPVLLLRRAAGLSRSPDELFAIAWADFYSPGYFTPAVHWLAEAAGRLGGGKTLENWLFPSLVMIVLGAAGALSWAKASREGRCPLPAGHPSAALPLLAAGALSGLVMTVPELRIGQREVPMPMLALLSLPGLDSIRVTGRFISLAHLALVVVCVVGVTQALRRAKPALRTGGILAIAALTLVTTQTFYPATGLDLDGPAEVNRELASHPAGLVVELPWSACPGYGCLFTEPPRMIWSRYDWFPRLAGYSAHQPEYWTEAQSALAGFPDEPSFAFLDRYRARYVILRVTAGENGDRFDPDAASQIAARAGRWPQVAAVRKVGRDYLLILR